jgi:HAD superfamily hydrolase (TIGR01549 family)
MKNKKYIFFDLGGTLINLNKSHSEILDMYLSEQNIHLSEESIIKSINAANTGVYDEVKTKSTFALYLSQAVNFIKQSQINSNNLTKVIAVLSKTNSYIGDDCNWELEPYAIELLNYLNDKYNLAIISNWDFSFHNMIKRFKFNDYMQFCICSDDIGYSKPDSRIFEVALARAGLSKNHDSVYVGDNYELDVLASKECGFKPYLYSKQKHNKYDCKVINNLAELMQII